MDGLIPMVFKAIKKNKIRRQYECLSSEAAQSYNTADFNSNIGHQSSMYVTHSGEKMEQRLGHRRHKSVGDFYVGYSSANGGGGFGGGGGGSPPPRAKQLVRFRSHRMFSCVTGAS